MSEHDEITRPLIDALNKTGGLALRMNSGRAKVKGGFLQLHAKGTADILFFPRGYIVVPELKFECATPIWLETKAVKKDHHKEQQENQAAFRAQVEALGHRWACVRSVKEGLEIALGAK
jgi:hypothetical protein